MATTFVPKTGYLICTCHWCGVQAVIVRAGSDPNWQVPMVWCSPTCAAQEGKGTYEPAGYAHG